MGKQLRKADRQPSSQAASAGANANSSSPAPGTPGGRDAKHQNSVSRYCMPQHATYTPPDPTARTSSISLYLILSTYLVPIHINRPITA
ncbi:hypothetical protein NQ314_020804 [Rhamnusium bicolor]|uniref:Uncharacterized protein n=1 Tax=Rhamnusium bicolor TaxID=1586634 RepID=A0AAV8WLJ1_9CUCU|nr:hypothetical protein NQ314_020804 [Rhamnusium bicolor]